MKELGWDCTALDPDIRSINHAKDIVGVKTIHGDFMEAENIDTYDVITLNRVLEHVEHPGELLEKSIKHLKTNGFMYVEVHSSGSAGGVSAIPKPGCGIP